jgi:hypothetical protein
MTNFDLREYTLYLRLTPEGMGSLRERVPEGDVLEAHVVAEKGYGLWIIPIKANHAESGDEEVFLLKWSHLQTASFMRPKEGLRPPTGITKT